MKEITQARLKELFSYEPKTGQFFRLILRGGSPAGLLWPHIDDCGRHIIKVDGKSYKAHRLAWLYVYGDLPRMLDHIDNDPSNNAIANLRISTRSQNAANSRRFATNSTGAKGVSRSGDRWRARILHQGKPFHLGYFKSLEAAGAAYDVAARKLFGEFARSA